MRVLVAGATGAVADRSGLTAGLAAAMAQQPRRQYSRGTSRPVSWTSLTGLGGTDAPGWESCLQ